MHDMLATFRTDPIPWFFKERNEQETLKNKHKGRVLFNTLATEIMETLRDSMQKDIALIDMKEICSNNE